MTSLDERQIIGIFQEHYGTILAVARRYAPAPGMDYDIVQQVFVHFAQAVRKHDWDLSGNTGALLYEITKNTAIAFWRNEQRQKSLALRAFEERLVRPRDPEADAATVERLKNDALLACLEKLSPRSRRLVERHYFENVSMESIAKELHGTGTAVRQMFCRIRIKLKKCIEFALKNR